MVPSPSHEQQPLTHPPDPPPWPAPPEALSEARNFILSAASSPHPTLLIPDRDADGLSSGTILSVTLQLLRKPPSLIYTHFVSLGRSIFSSEERGVITHLCKQHSVSHIIVLDQGSRVSSPLVDDDDVKTLVIDHHHAHGFPEGAVAVSAANNPPVATSSLLTYILCAELHPEVREKAAWISLVGLFGDLGAQTKIDTPPYPPELAAAKKMYKITHIVKMVSLVNAPRRTPECNTVDAWRLLQLATAGGDTTPKMILDGDGELVLRLKDARERVNSEVKRCGKEPPRFTKDGRTAVVRIHSRYQIHGVVATRWARSLKGKDLKMVLVANDGYIDGRVNFSCRVVRGKEEVVDVIALLKGYAERDAWVRDNVGTEFANGHRQASGGGLEREVWERFLEKGLEVEMNSKGRETRKREEEAGQRNIRNTLDMWVKKLK
ncbi:DHH phosphoesterase [Trichophaea hybrida]|nr:DHH phosphoesterase [Trichophaea hybrida]